ncbi:MAG: ester cyclase [Chloroflexi bacterium]|nr:ester cyclase [Chloroflexota bacterium]
MSIEQNKTIARRHYEEAKNLEVAFEMIAPEVVWHGFPGMPHNYEGWKLAHEAFVAAFPDMELTVEDQVAEGNAVVSRWTFRGTHQGELQGIPPTGKQVICSGVSIDRVANGKVVEHWIEFDQLGMMQQLGVVPPPEQNEIQ